MGRGLEGWWTLNLGREALPPDLCTYAPVCTCTCAHAPVCTCTCTCVHMRLCAHAPVCTCTCVHMRLCAHAPVCKCTCVRMHLCAHTPVCTCAHAHMHTCTQAHRHTGTQAHMHLGRAALPPDGVVGEDAEDERGDRREYPDVLLIQQHQDLLSPLVRRQHVRSLAV